MSDYVIYHNPDQMGYSALDVAEGKLVTNKAVSRSTIGSRVWLLTGEGRPRQFYIRAYMTIADLRTDESASFVNDRNRE